MDGTESAPACNFPEMLARDLEMSEATFLAKRMTAGVPIRSLATPTPERQKQSLCSSTDNHSPHVHFEDSMSAESSLGVIDEASCHSDSDGNGTTPSEVASLTSDSGTDSGPEMEPPSVRTRPQSVCTTGACVVAHSLPPKEQPGYSLVALEDSYQGQSWIDLDVEDSEDDDYEAAQTARAGLGTEHTPECAVDLPEATGQGHSSSSGFGEAPDGRGNEARPLSLDRVVTVLPASSFPPERPHTSSGVPAQEHPRLVDVPHSSLSHRRPSSLEIPYVPSQLRLQPDRHPAHNSWPFTSSLASRASDFDHEAIQREALHVSIPARSHARMRGMEATANVPDRAVPWTGAAGGLDLGQDEPIDNYLAHIPQDGGEHAAAYLTYDSSTAADEQMNGAKVPFHLSATAPTAEQEPATPESSDTSDSSVVETFFRSKIALSDTQASHSRDLRPVSRPASASTAKAPVNMRLHPDVFYRLEVSINGFPDTMLSTRALPIDIIRSLPKKLDYRGSSSPLTFALEQPDLATSPKWKVSSLRKRDSPPPPPSPPTSLLHAPSQPTPASIIQRVFPRGSTVHCDSLYAHLVAYTYLTSLCGPDPFLTGNDPSAPAPTTTSRIPGTRNLMHRLEPRGDDATAIPRKASMLLGMGKTTAAASDVADVPRLGKVRSLFFGKGRGKGKGAGKDEMVPAKSEGGGGRSRPVTEGDVRVVQAGLLRCVRCLVAKLKTADGGRGNEERTGHAGWEGACEAGGWMGLDLYLLRALCELVRAEEERLAAAAV